MRLPLRRAAASCVLAVLACTTLPANPATRRLDIDFGRTVPSRNLAGLAARSDGRLVAGPLVRELGLEGLPELLWSIAPLGRDRFVLGSGPEGQLFTVVLEADAATLAPLATLDDTHVFALLPLGDDELLAGTSPGGRLVLVRGTTPVAQMPLPADSIFDLAVLEPGVALVATGNPGRLFRVDLAKFAAAGMQTEKPLNDTLLAAAGITRFGEVRDRNLRRLLVDRDGQRVLAGSAPRGVVYEFPLAGGEAIILHEARDAEVTDLRLGPDGALHALFVYGGRGPAPRPAPILAGEGADRADFAGRSEIVRLPRDGFAEPVAARNGIAFYRLSLRGNSLLVAGGERGELLEIEPVLRLLTTFPGASSAQVNGLLPLDAAGQRWLLMGNNPAGFAVLDFAATGTARTAETTRLDLGQPGRLGLLRFARLRGVEPEQLGVEFRLSQSPDETEGWTPWQLAQREGEAFRLPEARARHVKVRVAVDASVPPGFEIGRAALFHLPQNRPPVINDFRIFPPNLALVRAPDPMPPPTVPLGQFLFPGQQQPSGRTDGGPATPPGADPARAALLASQVVPSPGNQIVYWSVSDPDGDSLAYTLEIRAENAADWTTVAHEITDTFVSFSTAALPEGLYFVRLTASEQEPRPAAERLQTRHEADDLVVDRTPPTVTVRPPRRESGRLVLEVTARDERSLLRGVEVRFNHGLAIDQTYPADGVLDSREETFVIAVPLEQVGLATAVEIRAVDAAGNRGSVRVDLP
jgi:hypothetical protein